MNNFAQSKKEEPKSPDFKINQKEQKSDKITKEQQISMDLSSLLYNSTEINLSPKSP